MHQYLIFSSEELYTEEDIKIMTGEKSPVHEPSSPMVNPSTGSVAQFFAQAQAHQDQEDGLGEETKEETIGNRPNIEPPVNMIAHPPGAMVTGGPPGMRLPIPVTSAPIQGKVVRHAPSNHDLPVFLPSYKFLITQIYPNLYLSVYYNIF